MLRVMEDGASAGRPVGFLCVIDVPPLPTDTHAPACAPKCAVAGTQRQTVHLQG
ncbi:MAG: hypothetical protein ACUVRT_07790 [Armatimonadota bacterium]